MKTKLLVFIAVCVLAANTAGAVLIEPDDYSNGTDLTAVISDVKLTVTTSNNLPVSIWSVTADTDPFGYAPTGQMVFGAEHIYFWNNDRRMHMDFARPVSSITLTAAGGDLYRSCIGRLEVYDVNFNLLIAYQTTPLMAHQSETMTIHRQQNDIFYAIAYSIGNSPFGRLDRLEFVIPEPATILLLTLGGLVIRKR